MIFFNCWATDNTSFSSTHNVCYASSWPPSDCNPATNQKFPHITWQQTIDQKWHKHEFEGLLSRAIQHEMDHLNGIFIVDRVSEVEKIKYKKELKTIEEDSKDYLSRTHINKEKFVL